MSFILDDQIEFCITKVGCVFPMVVVQTVKWDQIIIENTHTTLRNFLKLPFFEENLRHQN